jgi:hypothetical protein
MVLSELKIFLCLVILPDNSSNINAPANLSLPSNLSQVSADTQSLEPPTFVSAPVFSS